MANAKNRYMRERLLVMIKYYITIPLKLPIYLYWPRLTMLPKYVIPTNFL